MADETRHDHAIGRASTTDGLPVAPSMLAAVEAVATRAALAREPAA